MARPHLPIDPRDFKTDAAYALRCRKQCRPDKCNPKLSRCWAALGTSDSLVPNSGATPECLACGGKVKISRGRW